MDIEYNTNTKPAGEKPATTKPANTKPAGAKPAGTKPVNKKPDNTKRPRRKGAAVVCALLTLVLTAAAAGYVWTNGSVWAQNNPLMLAQETVIPNISADMISAIDPAVIENYRAAHNVAARQSLYCYLPENAFKTPQYVNTDLTEDCVAAVTELTIDRKRNVDLTALPYFKNLSVLRITHAEFLTDADIADMNRLNLTEVEFIIDRNDITNMQKFADFSACTAQNKYITLKNANFINENTAYAIYHLFGKYYPSVVCTGLDYDLYKKLDDRLQELINKVDFTNCRDDRDRILKSTVVVMKHLYYDYTISNYSATHNTLDENDPVYELAVYYNDCQLSSNLLTDGIGYGCCTNYSSLLLAVCVRQDYEAYIINGKRRPETGFTHDWLYVYADGEYYDVDMTMINTWFKNSSGMFHGYNWKFIEGDGDIMDDPDFMERYRKQVFETYHNKIVTSYEFFDDPLEQIPQISPQIPPIIYNAADTPVMKYIPDFVPGQSKVQLQSAAVGGAVLLFGLAVTLIVGRKRRA